MMNKTKGLTLIESVFIIALVSIIVWLVGFKIRWGHEPPEFYDNCIETLEARAENIEREHKDTGKPYDIDETIRTIYSIELALGRFASFNQLVEFVLDQNPLHVAPDVLRIRAKLFRKIKLLDDIRLEKKENEKLHKDFVGLFGWFDFSGDVKMVAGVPTGKVKFGVNREAVNNRWKSKKKGLDISKRVRKRENELLDLVFEYAKIYYKYFEEWVQLCSIRDRVYIAVHHKHWDLAVAEAERAVELAPYDREAHLLYAQALIERNKPGDMEKADEFLSDFIANRHQQEAPAYLLRGVLKMDQKQFKDAIVDLDQAGAYYPKQEKFLLDMLGPYRIRADLIKTREGRYIVNRYEAMMAGAGYYSHDFQEARLKAERGEHAAAREKILDHFERRRKQHKWYLIREDLEFLQEYLDPEDYRIILPEEPLAIRVEDARFIDRIELSVTNESKRDLHNVAMIYCIRFTDMYRDHYLPYKIGKTIAELPAGETIVVGRKPIDETIFGVSKTRKDIVRVNAVLIADEIVQLVEVVKTAPVIEETEPTSLEETSGETTGYSGEEATGDDKGESKPEQTKLDVKSGALEEPEDLNTDKSAESKKENLTSTEEQEKTRFHKRWLHKIKNLFTREHEQTSE